MADVPDVNVLVSLTWPNHVHHERAHRWFGARRTPWATTPVTESGFVRVSSNPAAIPTAVTPPEALALLVRMRASKRHVFLPDDVPGVVGAEGIDPARLLSYRMVTDAHLLALARRHRARLVTFDRAVAALGGAGARDVLVLSPPGRPG